MRVVDYQKSTTTLPYQMIKGIGMVAGVFSLVVCILLIANNLSLKKTDPIHSPALLHWRRALAPWRKWLMSRF